MRRVTLTLVLGLAGVACAIGLTLAHAPTTVARTNRPPGQPEQEIASSRESSRYCQADETLPRGTSALRVWLDAAYGPRVTVEVSAHGRRIASGQRGSGWIGGAVTVPVTPLARTISEASVCVSFDARDETVIAQGNPTPAASATRDGTEALAGRLWIEYLRPGSRSWASLAASTAQRMGFGRAAPGIWVVFAALALMAAVLALAFRLVLSELP